MPEQIFGLAGKEEISGVISGELSRPGRNIMDVRQIITGLNVLKIVDHKLLNLWHHRISRACKSMNLRCGKWQPESIRKNSASPGQP
jgi:hypothetical protein